MNKILYSQCWEDPLILEEALKINRNDCVLSISSAGDNTLFLLSKNPKKLVSIDFNEKQNFLLELKAASIKVLDYKTCLGFLGFSEQKNRILNYNLLKKCLSKDCINFWDKNLNLIDKGVIHIGKFEKYINFFRKFILPISQSKENIQKLISLKNLKEQRFFYNKIWNNLRWKLTFRIFFSKFLMKSFGRDKNFFKHNKNKKISEIYLNRIMKGFTKIPTRSNYFLHYILLGKFNLNFLPEYIKEENFYKIKKNLYKLEILTEDIRSFLRKKNKIKFNKFNLSDIFELFSEKDYKDFINNLSKISPKGTIICYWNNLVGRYNHGNKKWLFLEKKVKNLSKKDRVFFYDKLIIEKLV